ncbi:GNAT family N-acetyltransferase [Planococcus sp. ISL-109]|uniref:GNAT family N-acetyltransferase n=1 Tax=Planococcus sp. ISL-109 TaxID=2819166 RepID=UPI001BEC7328|nr:GNAT family N-acetyltransferase [Planococcus sp. ISL-109]MBT2583422.1 GNAT family N-acetyltransferase [Planococcus sp. ISL-109]
MKEAIRPLTGEDFQALQEMQTGIDDDYVIRVFDHISNGHNRLFGLFQDGHLASIGGYTIFAGSYVMLGRMRSDLRFRGLNLSTRLMAHVRNAALEHKGICFVGANTEESNIPAQRVLENIGLAKQSVLVAATAADVRGLESGAIPWRKVESLEEKMRWLQAVYIRPGRIFPFECYYPFPATADLFSKNQLTHWDFFENPAQDRVVIAKHDVKKYDYLHTLYPWNDLLEQPGLWETLRAPLEAIRKDSQEGAFIWIDLTHEQVHKLPDGHPFDLSSPWFLYGTQLN